MFPQSDTTTVEVLPKYKKPGSNSTNTLNRPGLLFLHGMFSGKKDLEKFTTYFEGSWKVMTPQLPILSFPLAETSVERIADFVLDYLDKENVERVIIGGNSLGGHIALLIALKHPDRVEKLILTGSSGLFERSFERGVPRRPDEKWVRAKIKEVFFDAYHCTDDLVAEILETTDIRDRARKIVRLAKSAKKNNLKEALLRITCPVTLIWGENDIITPPEVAREFHEHLPNSELFFIPKCGHAPTIERPEQFNAIVEKCLEKYLG